MPELGKYAAAVLGSWAATLALMAFIVALTWAQARRARRALEAIEARQARKEG